MRTRDAATGYRLAVARSTRIAAMTLPRQLRVDAGDGKSGEGRAEAGAVLLRMALAQGLLWHPPPMRLQPSFTSIFLAAVLACAGVAARAESLSQRVDALIEVKAKAAKQPLAAPASDAEFFRRAWLDFNGNIPSAEDTRKFLANPAKDKRAKLIDQLFAAPEFPARMAEVFNIQLMERNGDNEEWRRYLTDSFRGNKPWDQMVREMVSPDFKDEKLRGAGHFIARRLEKVGQQETDYPGVTRDTGRLFMGVDLQCCQCHKHLTVPDYKQVDFNGLFVAFQNVKLQPAGGDYKSAWLSEGLFAKKVEFVSVLNRTKGETGPRVPLGAEVEIPKLPESEQWIEPPDKKKRNTGVPKFSPLKELSLRLASAENPFFARNIANRVWFVAMGRGLIEPLDLIHSENPASHPELMDLLAKEITEHKFDIRWLLHELALTLTYGRSSILPADAKDAPENLFTVAKERPLAAEQLARAFLAATGERERVIEGKGWEGIEGKKIARKDFEKAFASAFANAAKEPELSVNPTLRSALFLRNNDLVLWSLQRRKGNLVDRLAALTDAAQIADELYISILTRPPTADEKTEIATYLTKHRADREKALGRYAWAMLSSMEFFANH